ncbi:Transmembrane protein 147 [Linum perenne]
MWLPLEVHFEGYFYTLINYTSYIQESIKALIGLVDVAGIYCALTQLTHRNISQNHKFQAVGLGWAFADSVLHRLAPLWVGERGLEFSWDYILQGLEANANLVFSISIAALGSLMWLRQNQTKDLDTVNICMCIHSGNHAFYHKLFKKQAGLAFSGSGGFLSCIFSTNGVYQLAALLRVSETFIIRNISLESFEN